MFAIFKRSKKKPSYPSPARQWQGLVAIIASIVAIEFISSNFKEIRNPAGLLALIVMFFTNWSGLRMGMICCAVIFGYLLVHHSNPGTLFEYSSANARRLINAAIGLPLYVLLVGGIGGKLRNARIQAFEAKDRAEAEEQQRLVAEADLQVSEQMRRLVVESAMDAIVAHGEDGRITLWNPSAAAKFGWSSNEAIGRPFSEILIPPAQRPDDPKGMQDFLRGGEAGSSSDRLEITALTKDGRLLPVELSVAHHDGPDGVVYVGFLRDMTEQKKLNDRLRQAQKMEAIGTLAGGIAHDFNNVLSAISGNILMAKEDVPPDNPAQESLTEIEKSVQRATYIVRQILTFSRPTEPDTQVVEVASILNDAIQLLKATIPSTMEVSCHAAENLPPVAADATDIHQLVLNLGINAFQALKGSSGKFEVQVNQAVIDAETAQRLMGITPGNYIRMSFGDTGCGMDSATMQRIFEPFFTTKSIGEGTGLGLAVVYGIVSRHRGAIIPYSEVGKGTVFHIYLPAAESQAFVEAIESTPPKPGNGEKVLYVDDDEALVFMMKRMLGRLNYDVQGYTEPLEGLAAFKNDPDGFDLVITDMSMPYLNGPELVQKMQEIRPDVPIVMVTGYIRPDDLEQARHLNIRELILKPNSVGEMSEVLHRILQKHQELASSRPLRASP